MNINDKIPECKNPACRMALSVYNSSGFCTSFCETIVNGKRPPAVVEAAPSPAPRKRPTSLQAFLQRGHSYETANKLAHNEACARYRIKMRKRLENHA